MPRLKKSAANPRGHGELLALSEASDFFELLLGEQNLESFTHAMSIKAVCNESKLFGENPQAFVLVHASFRGLAFCGLLGKGRGCGNATGQARCDRKSPLAFFRVKC